MLSVDSALANQEPDVILVEASARPGDMKQLKAKYGKNRRVTLLPLKENRYFVWGINQGIKEALKRNYGIITPMNNDATVDEGYFKKVESLFKRGDLIGIIQPKTMFGFTDTIYSAGVVRNLIGFPCLRGHGQRDRTQFANLGGATEYASMVICSVRRAVFEDIGLLDEDYVMYLDDLDFSIKAKNKGWLIAYMDSAVARHHVLQAVGQTSSKQIGWVRQLTERNLLLIAKKNGYLTWAYILIDALRALKVCVCSPRQIPSVIKGKMWFWGGELNAMWNEMISPFMVTDNNLDKKARWERD